MSEGAAKGFGEKPQPKKEERRKFQAIKGTRDLLPPETALWNRVEQIAQEVFTSYGFGEIRLPIFEQTELFARAVGGETDIVSKEMYTFESHGFLELEQVRAALISRSFKINDELEFSTFEEQVGNFVSRLREKFDTGEVPRTPENEHILQSIPDLFKWMHHCKSEYSDTSSNLYAEKFDQYLTAVKVALRSFRLGDVLTLRPEATASICRAYIENGMQQLPQPVKLYTIGPMFRRERPQKGRYRQFYQIDAEVLGGSDAPGIDAELIEMVMTFFERLGLEGVQLEINSIGHAADNCRRGYVEQLRKELSREEVKKHLGPDSLRRIEANPLRVLDSKLESEQKVIEKLPHISDYLCEECAENYRGVKKELELRGVKYHENWRLVRGLDYYSRTTFEITAPGLGSQNAVCGGGRYDGLMELLGGPPTRATGFAIGEDRLILSLLEQAQSRGVTTPTRSGQGGEWRVASGKPHVYIAWMGEKVYATAIRAAKTLRASGFSVELPPVEQKFGKALGQADKLGARFALILGDHEVSSGEWTLKTLASGEQIKVAEAKLVEHLRRAKGLSC